MRLTKARRRVLSLRDPLSEIAAFVGHARAAPEARYYA